MKTTNYKEFQIAGHYYDVGVYTAQKIEMEWILNMLKASNFTLESLKYYAEEKLADAHSKLVDLGVEKS